MRRPGAPSPDHCRLTEHGETRSPQCGAAAAAAHMALAAEARRRRRRRRRRESRTYSLHCCDSNDCGQ